jgi:hypothetical protein
VGVGNEDVRRLFHTGYWSNGVKIRNLGNMEVGF